MVTDESGSSETNGGPLAGVRILDLSRLYPGAMATSLLADLGADVVKVEAPGFGDGMRFISPDDFASAHIAFNRGKRSLTLDLKHPDAPAVLRRLVASVDVVVESQRPGMFEKLGVGFEQIRVEQPGLIWCSISGFGPDGPLADAPGHDITYLGYSGVLGQLATDGELPPVPDIVVAVPMAALFAVIGILAAHAERQRTGRGSRVDANMVDASMWLLSENLARQASAPGEVWGSLASRGVYRCADGRLVTVAASEARCWVPLCEALDLPDLVDHRLGVDEVETTARLAAAFARQHAAVWLQNPGLRGGVGPVHQPADLLEDPHVLAREGMVALEADAAQPNGIVPRVLANPLRFDRAKGEASTHGRTAPPDLGSDSETVLAAAGFTAAEISSLRENKVV
jgi:alpha-methylacyl-CoA racemase